MRVTVLQGIEGRLVTVYGIIMLIPLLFALYDRDPTIKAFAVSSLITIIFGAFLWSRGKNEGKIRAREGFAAVAGIWLIAVIFGAMPYYFSGYMPSYLNSLFEATSGLTTTGATIIEDIEALPRSLLLWRSLTHWLGGIGIIVFFIILIPKGKMGAVYLYKAEVPGPDKERLSPKIRDTAMILLKIYLGFTLSAVILLTLAGMSLFDAVNHAFSCVATGGFSTKNASIGAYDSFIIELIVIVFMLLSGINFTIYINTWRKGSINIVKNTELKVYLGMILGVTVIVTASLFLQKDYHLSFAVREALFQVVSVITTTGFVVADFDTWPSQVKMILFFLMFIGGCAASTSGGIKIMRIILLFKMGGSQIRRAIHPQLVTNVVSGDKIINPAVLRDVAHFFFLFIFIFVIMSIVLAATGIEPFDAMGAAIAALGNAGPGFGVVGPSTTYATLAPLGKVVMIIGMLLGRLELMALLVLIQPEFWKGNKNW